MSSPSLQLDVENVIKTYLGQINVFGGNRPMHAAHAIDTELDGTFLLIAADPPNWEEMKINAVLQVRFEFATIVKDPTARVAASAQHETDVGAIINLFAEQNFQGTLDGLNNAAAASQLGFTGWEATKAEPDGTTETQIVGKHAYDFIVFLTA